MRPAAGRFVNYGDRKAVNAGYSDRCSRTSRTARSRATGSIFLGMTNILPTQKDAASNLGRFNLRGSALGFRNLNNYITRSLLETSGFRPHLHPELR